MRRSFELWRELQQYNESIFTFKDNEDESKRQNSLLNMTGGLMIGLEDSEVVQGTLASIRTYGLPHEILSTEDIRRRFPAFNPRSGEI